MGRGRGRGRGGRGRSRACSAALLLGEWGRKREKSEKWWLVCAYSQAAVGGGCYGALPGGAGLHIAVRCAKQTERESSERGARETNMSPLPPATMLRFRTHLASPVGLSLTFPHPNRRPSSTATRVLSCLLESRPLQQRAAAHVLCRTLSRAGVLTVTRPRLVARRTFVSPPAPATYLPALCSCV